MSSPQPSAKSGRLVGPIRRKRAGCALIVLKGLRLPIKQRKCLRIGKGVIKYIISSEIISLRRGVK
jgi:hypothetical protein